MRSSRKYVLLAGLYVAQTLPGHFFSNVFPVVLREHGASLASIGYLQVIGLPWLLKFLWAPLVDRLVGPRGLHARVIVALEALFCLSTLALAFVDFRAHFALVVGLMTLSYAFAATQDVAVDALAIRLLSQRERGPGNAVQTGGNIVGALLGTAGGLALYQLIGWSGVLIALALALLPPLLPLAGLGRRAAGAVGPPSRHGGMLGFFGQPGAKRWSLIMLASHGGSMASMMMSKPLLVDLGFSAAGIGLLTGVYGLGLGLVGAWAGGRIIVGLGRKAALALGCLLSAVAAASLAPLALGLVSGPYLLTGLGLSGVGLGLTMTAINTIAMDFARAGHEGADYSLQVAISMLGGGVVMGASGVLAQALGYLGLFALCALLCLGAAGLAWFFFRERRPAAATSG
ncbi:MFS transporter [Desulfarculus baarsii]